MMMKMMKQKIILTTKGEGEGEGQKKKLCWLKVKIIARRNIFSIYSKGKSR